VGGIARFVEETYAASFGRQWNRYDVARPEEDRAVFEVKAGVRLEELRGLRVMDAGCGGGRYSRLLGEAGAEVLGVDRSVAVEKAAELCRAYSNVKIIQADLLGLPVVESAFDFVFSIGVLHHAPDARAGFESIARRVKVGGRLAVWLYRRNTWPQEVINGGVRRLTTRMPSGALESVCFGLGFLGGVPVLNRTLNKVLNFSSHPDWTLRICDNFDWYAPRYQSHHTIEELRGWFESAGFGELRVLRPEKGGGLYDWAYDHNLLIGSGVNIVGTRVRSCE
jgi:SAM-dependent methyltransferase